MIENNIVNNNSAVKKLAFNASIAQSRMRYVRQAGRELLVVRGQGVPGAGAI